MKKIIKGQPPKSLVEYRRKKGASYAALDSDVKRQLREALLKEQGYLCCYCTRRIPESTRPGVKIEHFSNQKQYSERALDYRNMLVACTGGQGKPQKQQTCDAHKADQKLTFDPTDNDKNIEDFIRYTADGRIFSENKALDRELNSCLNLNNEALIEVRQVLYKRVTEAIRKEGKKLGSKPLKTSFLKNSKEEYLDKNAEGKYKPFCMVGVYVVNKYLKKLNQT